MQHQQHTEMANYGQARAEDPPHSYHTRPRYTLHRMEAGGPSPPRNDPTTRGTLNDPYLDSYQQNQWDYGQLTSPALQQSPVRQNFSYLTDLPAPAQPGFLPQQNDLEYSSADLASLTSSSDFSIRGAPFRRGRGGKRMYERQMTREEAKKRRDEKHERELLIREKFKTSWKEPFSEPHLALEDLKDDDFSLFKNFTDGFMFICNATTEQQCMDGLFGASISSLERMKKITPTTALFLFRVANGTDRNSTGGGLLHGVFRCKGKAGKNLEPKGFRGVAKDRFPAQIRAEPYYRFPYPIKSTVCTEILGDTNRCGALTRDEVNALLTAFAKNCVEDVTRLYLKRQIGLKQFVPITQMAYKWPEDELDKIQESCRAP